MAKTTNANTKKRALLATVVVLTGTLLFAGVWSRTRDSQQTALAVNDKNKDCSTAVTNQWYVKVKTGGCKGADSKAGLVFGAFDQNNKMYALRIDAKNCDDLERGREGYYAFGMPSHLWLKEFWVCSCTDDSWFGQPYALGSSEGIQNPITFDMSPYNCEGRGWTFSKESKDEKGGSKGKKCRRFEIYRQNSGSIAKGWKARMKQEYDHWPHGLQSRC